MDRELNILISEYLTQRGWVKYNTNRDNVNLYVESTVESPYEILLPTINIKNYDNYIEKAIKTLVEYEDTNENNIIKLIKNIDKDFEDYKIKNVKEDHIQLQIFTQILESAKNSIKKAAKYEQKEQINKLGKNEKKSETKPDEKAALFLKECYFPHTWKSSFGITIETPLWSQSIGMYDDAPDPFGRKVSKRILNGFKVLNESVKKGSYNYILDNISNSEELLMFNQYSSMIENIKDNEIMFSIKMSPSVKVEKEILTTPHSIINYSLISNLTRAIEQVKRPDKEYKVNIIGFPETLTAKQNDLINALSDDYGYISLKGIADNNIGNITLHVKLPISQYKKAIYAQEKAKNVKARCKIKKVNRMWEIIEIYEFELIN